MICRIFHYHRNALAEFLEMTLYIPLSVQSLDMFLSAWIRVDPVPDPKCSLKLIISPDFGAPTKIVINV